MSERLEVIITGKDGASRVFQDVAKSAKAAGDAVEAAGKSGSVWDDLDAEVREVAQSMRLAADSAEDAGDSVGRSGESARKSAIDFDKLGAAAVIVGGYLTVAGNSALDQIQTIEGLRSAYGDAADEMLAFADQMAATTIFNDDDILRGERYFATLANNYDLPIAQVQQLMQTTADLASAYGTSFEDASSRITAAIRGEGEAAEYLGLTMNQQAIDRENLTLTMSNQEAAAFRLNALYAQTDVYAGTAQRLVETEVGARARLTNMIQDNTQALANFIGPYNSILAGMATGAVGIAQFAGGFAALASGIKTATLAGAAFAATPIGLAVIGLTAVVGLGTAEFMEHRAEVKAAEEQYRSMMEAAAELSAQIGELRLEDWADADWAKRLSERMMGEIDWQENWLQDSLMKSFGTGDWFDQMVTSLLPGNIVPGELQAAWEAQAATLIESMIPDDADRERVTTAFADLLSLRGVLGDTHWDAIQSEMNRLFAAFDAADGAITVDQLTASLQRLYEMNLKASQGVELASLAQNRLTAETQRWADLGMGSVGAMTTDMNEYTAATQTAAGVTFLLSKNVALLAGQALGGGGVAAIVEDMDDLGNSAGKAITQMALLAAQEAAVAAGFFNMGSSMATDLETMAGAAIDPAIERLEELRTLASTVLESGFAGAEALAQATLEKFERLRDMILSVTGMDDPLSQFNATSMATGASELAQNLRDAGVAADDLFRVLVGNTNQIKSQADATLSWAEELINVRGELGLIDDLVNKGLLTGTSGVFDDGSQYAAAQDAYDSIAISTAQITDNLNAIQAIQSPLIAAMQEQQAAYTEELLKQPAAVQLTALAWMDAATASRAFEVQALAASAATGDLGTNGVAAVTQYIDSIVRAEPATAALLEQLGLIQNVVRDSSGMILSYEVNLDGAEGARSEIAILTESIDRLTAAILGIPVAELNVEDNATPVIEETTTAFEDYEGKVATGYVVGDNSNAMGVIDESSSALNTLDGQTAMVSVLGTDLASGVIAGAQGALNAIDGQSATVSIYANNFASAAISAAHAALDALNGRTATTYVNTVRGVTYGPSERHGGVAGYAHGGTIDVWASEAGTEIAHFATGGSIPLPGEGLRGLPPGTYIEPAPSARDSLGGGDINVYLTVQGSLTTENDLKRSLVSEIRGALKQRNAAIGVRS
jgi:hypothetical protein